MLNLFKLIAMDSPSRGSLLAELRAFGDELGRANEAAPLQYNLLEKLFQMGDSGPQAPLMVRSASILTAPRVDDQGKLLEERDALRAEVQRLIDRNVALEKEQSADQERYYREMAELASTTQVEIAAIQLESERLASQNKELEASIHSKRRELGEERSRFKAEAADAQLRYANALERKDLHHRERVLSLSQRFQAQLSASEEAYQKRLHDINREKSELSERVQHLRGLDSLTEVQRVELNEKRQRIQQLEDALVSEKETHRVAVQRLQLDQERERRELSGQHMLEKERLNMLQEDKLGKSLREFESNQRRLQQLLDHSKAELIRKQQEYRESLALGQADIERLKSVCQGLVKEQRRLQLEIKGQMAAKKGLSAAITAKEAELLPLRERLGETQALLAEAEDARASALREKRAADMQRKEVEKIRDDALAAHVALEADVQRRQKWVEELRGTLDRLRAAPELGQE